MFHVELLLIPIIIGLLIFSKKIVNKMNKNNDERKDQLKVTDEEYERVLNYMFASNIINTKEYLHLQSRGGTYKGR